MKILVIGPSPSKSRGGMATVIDEINKDKQLKQHFQIDIYESYIDGGRIKVFIYSIFAFLFFYITKRNYDLYHIHVASYGSTFRKGFYVRAAKKWGKKVILHVHGAEYMVFYEKSKNKARILSILNSADKVVALSNEWKNTFENVFNIKNCIVLENGIDMDKFKFAVNNEKMEPRTFLALGRLGKRKGTYDLIDAIANIKKQIPDIKCYLAGDGEIDKCKSLIQKKGLQDNIYVVGWVDFDMKLELLKKTSVLVLPSYNEGLPMAILEGMASGKPIISTNVGAIPEVIVNGVNGVLINPGNISELEIAMIKYATDFNYVKIAQDANLKLVNQKYSMEVMHNKLKQIYFQLVNDI